MRKELSMQCPLCEEFCLKYPPEPDPDRPYEMIHVFERNEDGSLGISSGLISCAFSDNGMFHTANWNCKTMNRLREIAGEHHDDEATLPWYSWFMRDDMQNASIGVIRIPEHYREDNNMMSGYLVMTWYKSRGRTGQAWIVCDDDEPTKLNLRTAQFIIEKLNHKPERQSV